MLLPGGMVLDERAAIIESMSIRLPMCGTRIREDLTNAKQDADAPRDEALMKTTRAVVAPYALGPFL
jgi:hypothetical protein